MKVHDCFVYFTAPKELEVDLHGACHFDLPESVTSRRIQDSSLWIYIQPKKHKKSHHRKESKTVYTVRVYVIQHKAKEPHLLKGPVRYKKTSSSGWYELKMAHIVHHWARHPGQNRGVVIQAHDTDGNNVVVTPDDLGQEEFVSNNPFQFNIANHYKSKSLSFIQICKASYITYL